MSVKINNVVYGDNLFKPIIILETNKMPESQLENNEKKLEIKIMPDIYNEILEYHKNNQSNSVGRVWLMLGSNDENISCINWESLNVAQAKHSDTFKNSRFFSEMIDNILAMCRNCYRDKSTELQGNETDSEINAEDSKSDKIQTKYRRNFFYNSLRYQYKYIAVYEVNVDEILGHKNTYLENDSIENVIYENAKHWFAEAKTAYITNSKYWKPYNGGLDYIAYDYYKNNYK